MTREQTSKGAIPSQAANRIDRPPAGLPKIVSSHTLFGPEREIGIEHDGALYRLKITRQGKLILNK